MSGNLTTVNGSLIGQRSPVAGWQHLDDQRAQRQRGPAAPTCTSSAAVSFRRRRQLPTMMRVLLNTTHPVVLDEAFIELLRKPTAGRKST